MDKKPGLKELFVKLWWVVLLALLFGANSVWILIDHKGSIPWTIAAVLPMVLWAGAIWLRFDIWRQERELWELRHLDRWAKREF